LSREGRGEVPEIRPPVPAKPVQKTANKNLYPYEVNCTRCGALTSVSFVPDGIRPVFCKDCLVIIKEEKKQELEARKKAKLEELEKMDEETHELRYSLDGQPKQPIEPFSSDESYEDGDFSAEDIIPDQAPLNELLTRHTVTFGRINQNHKATEGKGKQGSRERYKPAEKQKAPGPAVEEKDLDEGEEIFFE
jgi:CxxC-x17-CxxC domain-containing protein